MTTHRLLVLRIAFLFCIAAVSSILAQENLPAIVKSIEPSTVVILTYDKEGENLAQGSGFFISNDGDVITNWHVFQGASLAEVKTADGHVYPVKEVLTEDIEGDLIRVSVDIPPNVVRSLSVSISPLEVGERVVVIGSPLGLDQTVSDGIVSAVREIPAFGKIIQITAPVSPGSSGSPVVNMKGEVIGVATFQIIEEQNLNFAIPGERVAKLTPGKGKTLTEWEAEKKEEQFTSAEELYSTGLTFLWTEDYEIALSYFEEAVKKNPHYAEAYFGIGYCNNKLGNWTDAAEAYNQLIRIMPDDADAHSGLGVAYVGLERYTEAVKAFKQAIRIKPDDVFALSGLGGVFCVLKRYTEAIKAFKQAIRIKPDDANAHCVLGLAYLSSGDRNSALQEYKILKDLDPDLANNLFNEIEMKQKLAEFEAELKKALEEREKRKTRMEEILGPLEFSSPEKISIVSNILADDSLYADIQKARDAGLTDKEIWFKFKTNHPKYDIAKEKELTDEQIIKALRLNIIWYKD
ncbi:MAG: tetratricopeptide repeat protein [candidate division WOR-3 bacterium]|nr:tetratricopeptide repeat protein [candidate division WOR-3 bacterium]